LQTYSCITDRPHPQPPPQLISIAYTLYISVPICILILLLFTLSYNLGTPLLSPRASTRPTEVRNMGGWAFGWTFLVMKWSYNEMLKGENGREERNTILTSDA
jgi:hypothetical protein